MAGQSKAAIDLDAVLDRPLGDLSAADFIQVLNHPKLSHAGLGIIADKKKYELWVEEGSIVRISVGELLKKLRGEKKKVEYELPPWFRFEPPYSRPQVEYGQLVEEIAARVEERLGQR